MAPWEARRRRFAIRRPSWTLTAVVANLSILERLPTAAHLKRSLEALEPVLVARRAWVGWLA